MSASRWVDLDVEEYWFPLSQIEDQGEHLAVGDKNLTVCVTQWIARQKGLYEGD